MKPAETAEQKTTAAPEAVKPAVRASQAEKFYDWAVYDGLINWSNLALSLYVADSLMHGWAKPVLERSINNTSKLLASTNLVSQEKAFKTVRPAMRTLSLTIGGWMLLAPMKWLEDNKRENVHWLQEKYFGGAKDEYGNHITADQLCLAAEPPKQSWLNVITRRLLATGVVTPTVGVMLDHTVGEHNITNFVVNHTNKALKSGFVPYGQQIAQRDTFQRYLSLAALDTLYCYITKQVMFYTNGTHGHSILGKIISEGDTKPCTQAVAQLDNDHPLSMVEKLSLRREKEAENLNQTTL